MIGSTGPTAGQLYIVDTFLVVVFGGAQSLLGTVASAFDDLAIAVDARILPYGLDGQGAHAAHGHRTAHAAAARTVRPQGQKVTAACLTARINSRTLELDRLRTGRGAHSAGAAADARHLPAQPRRQVPDLRVRRGRSGAALGQRRHAEPGAGRVLRPGRLLHGDVPEAGGVRASSTPRFNPRPASRISWTGTRSRSCRPSGFPSSRCRSRCSRSSWSRRWWRSSWARRCSSGASAASISRSSPRRWRRC